MPPEKLGFLIGAIIGGLVAGSVCGLLPLWLGFRANRSGFAVVSFCLCAVSGVILGLLLALPMALILSGVILAMGKHESERDIVEASPDEWNTPQSKYR